jgi:Fe-S cluster biogenesis protein NfuA
VTAVIEAPPSEDDVRAALDTQVRRFVQAHAGDVDVVSVSEDGVVRVRFYGACAACPAAGTTLAGVVAPPIERLPGVKRVQAEGVNISAAAAARIQRLRLATRRSAAQTDQASGGNPDE